jgi:glycosyltransferase involved in cell wall biosynthesis
MRTICADSSAEAAAPPTARDGARPALLSVVCPAFNEAANLEAFCAVVDETLSRAAQPYEIVFVNDGSRDATLPVMRALKARRSNITIVDLSRNYGKEIAMSAGLDHARGDAVVIIDADLQHPPQIIPEMIAGWRDGYDIVYGVRRSRENESWLRRSTARAFYRLMSKVGRVPIPEDAGDFRLLSRKAVDAIISMREQHRFMKGVFAWIGFPTKAVPYDVAARAAGKSKFNFWTLWNFSIEGLTSHTLAPLKASTYLGLAVAFLALVYGAYVVGETILQGNPVPGYPTLVTLILLLGGVQLIVLGVMGEYLGRVFNETKRRPLYFANDVLLGELPARGAEPRR